MRKSPHRATLMPLLISALLIFLLFRVVDLSDLLFLFRRLDIRWLGVYLFLAAFLAGSGYNINALIFTHVLLGVAAAEMSSTLPIHSPGGLGTWDVAWILAFVAMGYDVKTAAASGLSVQLLSKVLEYLLGTAGVLFLFGRRF